MRNAFTVICLLVIIFGVAFLADNMHQKQRQPRQVNEMGKLVPLKGSEPTSSSQDSKSAQQVPEKAPEFAKPVKVYIEEPVTVNLPAGEIFLYVIPGEQAMEAGLDSSGHAVYVTSNRPVNRVDPRKITFWGPGNMPHTWKPLLHIQEH